MPTFAIAATRAAAETSRQWSIKEKGAPNQNDAHGPPPRGVRTAPGRRPLSGAWHKAASHVDTRIGCPTQVGGFHKAVLVAHATIHIFNEAAIFGRPRSWFWRSILSIRVPIYRLGHAEPRKHLTPRQNCLPSFSRTFRRLDAFRTDPIISAFRWHFQLDCDSYLAAPALTRWALASLFLFQPHNHFERSHPT